MVQWLWIVRVARVALRAEPAHASAQVSELLWGEPQDILEERQGWVYVRGWLDGYAGWVPAGALGPAYWDGSGWQVVQRQSFYQHRGRIAGWVGVGALFPRSGVWLTAQGDYRLVSARAKPYEPLSWRAIWRLFRQAPYAWGGKSTSGVDCSGLVQLAFRLRSQLLPRDAYQQAAFLPPTPSPKVGDLVFFTSASNPSGRVSHVGIYVGRGRVLHATPAAGVHIAPLKSLHTHVIHSFRRGVGEDFVI
ncbi:MAG: C40 family peptidase [Bacteroidia bacterium]